MCLSRTVSSAACVMCLLTADCRDELQKAEVIFADPKLVQLHLADVAGAKWIHSTMAGGSMHVLVCYFIKVCQFV